MPRPFPLLLSLLLALTGCDLLDGSSSAPSGDWRRPVPGDAASLRLCKDSLLARMSRIHGLPILHPVQVSWIARERLPALLDSLEAASGADTSSQAFTYDRLCYAMGYTSAPGQYDSATSAFSASELLGFYVQGSNRLWVVTDATADSARLINTLAHELVHALQDQSFDLTARRREARSLDAHQALTFLIEGDAQYASVLFKYDNPTLSWIDAHLRFNGLAQARSYIADDPDLSAMPMVATLPRLVPYFRGTGLVHEIREEGGWPLVSDILSRPLTSTRNCLVAGAGIARTGHQEFQASHPFPLLADQGWELLGSDRFGSVMIGTLLLTRLGDYYGVPVDVLRNMPWFGAWNGDRAWIWRKGEDYTVALAVASTDAGSAGDFWRNWNLATSDLNPSTWNATRHGRSLLSGSTVYLAWTTGEDTAAGAALADLSTLGAPTSAAGRTAAAATLPPSLPRPSQRPQPLPF